MTFLRRFFERSIERSTLRWVNDERQRRGMEPLDHLPLGTRAKSMDCVIARALSDDSIIAAVDHETATLMTGGQRSRVAQVALPNYVGVFVRAFDKGEYPHLIERDELHRAA